MIFIGIFNVPESEIGNHALFMSVIFLRDINERKECRLQYNKNAIKLK